MGLEQIAKCLITIKIIVYIALTIVVIGITMLIIQKIIQKRRK